MSKKPNIVKRTVLSQPGTSQRENKSFDLLNYQLYSFYYTQ